MHLCQSLYTYVDDRVREHQSILSDFLKLHQKSKNICTYVHMKYFYGISQLFTDIPEIKRKNKNEVKFSYQRDNRR